MIYIEHIPLVEVAPSNKGFQVEARVISYGGVPFANNTPTLYWKTGESWNRLPMKEGEDNNFYANIPSQPSRTTINYYIYAEDSNGKTRSHPYIGASDPHSFHVKKRSNLQIRGERVLSG